jgi:hypothetical protein
MKSITLTALVVMAFLISGIYWNHSVQPIPAERALNKIIIGQTTVGEAKRLLGTCIPYHSCTGSGLYRYIPPESLFIGRGIEINIDYWGPNTGLFSSDINLVPDDDEIIRDVQVMACPRIDAFSDQLIESLIGTILDWEYNLTNKYIGTW